MHFGVIETPTMKDLFVQRVEDLILSGKLKVGDKLPTERELGYETKISRSVIHSALTELEKTGFVEIIPRKGTFVANYADTGTLGTLSALLRHNGGKLSRKQIESLFEARVAIEGTAMRKLALTHTEDDIKALEQIIVEAESYATDNKAFDVSEMAEKLFAFSHCVCVRSGNMLFPLMNNDFKAMTLAFWEDSVKIFGAQKNIHLIKRYLSEIIRGDGDAVYNRLERSANEFLSCYDE